MGELWANFCEAGNNHAESKLNDLDSEGKLTNSVG